MTIEEYIRKFIDPKLEQGSLPFKTRHLYLNRGSVITDYGQHEKNIYFIKSGIAQLTFLTNDLKERILFFHTENTFVGVISSYYLKIPSDVQLSCVTECDMEYIDLDELENISKTSLLASNFVNHELKSLIIKLIKKQKDIYRKRATDMYSDLFESHPDLVKRLSVKKLAQYLGIYPESLSRIRRDFLKQ
ncbi:MAG: hypothetical protein KKC03_02180 [Bacteroidetes bacterium]|nr:hypothetical protein [Bacteroidota bacterium]